MGRRLHIAIVTYNRLESTIKCIESVVSKTDADFRLTVVDNGSKSETVAYLLRLYNKKVIDDLYLFDRNMGVPCGYNFALSISQEPFFVRLDNDIIIQDSSWATVLMEALTSHKEAGTVGFHVWANCPEDTIPELRDCVVFVARSFTTGACCMSRRDVHERLGFWCEDYGIYGEEDADFGFRLYKAGFTAGYIDKRGKYILHEHTPYETDDVGPLRNNKNRVETLKMFLLNKFMYKNGMRELFMGRKYDAKVDGLRVTFTENQDYARYMEEVRKLGRKIEPILAADFEKQYKKR